METAIFDIKNFLVSVSPALVLLPISILIFYFLLVIYNLIKNRNTVDFDDIVLQNNKLSKTGVAFFIILSLIMYQAIVRDDITSGLVELMFVLLAADLGFVYLSKGKCVTQLIEQNEHQNFSSKKRRNSQ